MLQSLTWRHLVLFWFTMLVVMLVIILTIIPNSYIQSMDPVTFVCFFVVWLFVICYLFCLFFINKKRDFRAKVDPGTMKKQIKREKLNPWAVLKLAGIEIKSSFDHSEVWLGRPSSLCYFFIFCGFFEPRHYEHRTRLDLVIGILGPELKKKNVFLRLFSASGGIGRGLWVVPEPLRTSLSGPGTI